MVHASKHTEHPSHHGRPFVSEAPGVSSGASIYKEQVDQINDGWGRSVPGWGRGSSHTEAA